MRIAAAAAVDDALLECKHFPLYKDGGNYLGLTKMFPLHQLSKELDH